MNKFSMMFMAVICIVCIMVPRVSSAAIADGTYSVNYQVNKPNDTSASIANDYFVKPATLTVKDGQMTMQLTIKSSTWVTEFNPPGGARVVSENTTTNERVVQFPVDRADVVTIPMKIDIDDIDYHHAYSVDFVFDSASLPVAAAHEAQQQTPATAVTEQQPQVEPQTQTAQAEQTKEAPKQQQSTEAATTSSQASPTTEPQASTTSSTAPVATETSTTAQEQNPETSDALPLVYGMLLIVAAFMFMRTTKRKAV